ncbi:LptA/OstA family protein [Enterobacter sp. CC120223-11]|uniref:LptA/OstA family protein n=1 Tax=Enterobacter sp. CC120223-11 TaxID=1378073 RepID=UPI000BC64820|nr:LptA/OstA family protein [Enterobacter sp. CC120223-11]SNY73303.1 OstA-like protein [Enterobacter sp. CC120223-11]
MKNLLTLSVVSAALFFAVPAYSMEVSADATQTLQEYNGNARIVFKPGEKFEISADKTSKNNGATVFSGNVVVTYEGTTLETDSMTLRKQADGAVLLEAKKFLMKHAGVK